MANWARAFDELGTGLLRQADIGGKAYEGAMAKEAEQRAADRELAREMRAAERADKLFEKESTRWIEQQGILQEYSIENLERRAELQEESDLKKFGRESAFTLKTWRMERYAAIRDLESKAKTERALLDIKNNVSRAESADKKVTSILTSLAAAMKEGETAETERLSKELEMAELHATEAWAKIPGVDPLTTRQLSDFTKFGIIGGEIVSAISLETGEKVFRQALTAIKGGKGSSGYDAAYETVSRTIDRIIEDNPTFKNYRGAKKRDLKKHIIEKLLPNVPLGEETDTVDLGNGDVGGTIGFRHEASVAIERLTEMSEADLIKSLRIGALAEAEAMTSPDSPGRGANPKQEAIRVAKRRDPEYLIEILEEAKGKPAYGSRRDKIDKLIVILKKFVASQKTSALPQETDMQVAGIVNQPGMIFEADRISMAAPDVNSRWAIPQRAS